MPLADSIDTAQGFISTLISVYIAILIAYILTSWLPLPYNIWLNRVQRFLYDVSEPYIRQFRRIVPQFSLGGLGLDISPILAIIVLLVLRAVALQGLEALQ
jgi:YggT family protein